MRAIYWDGRREGDEAGVFGRQGPKFDYDIRALQAGFDIVRDEDEKGVRDFIGFFGAYGQIESEVYHFSRAKVGTNQVDAYSLGGYWTRFDEKDAYLDGVIMFSWYDATAQSRRLPELRANTTSFTASIEAGKPFRFDDRWVLQPQAQLIYQHNFGSKVADQGGPFRYDDTDSLLGRLGARLAKSWDRADEGEESRLTTAWLRLSLWHEFLDQPSTTFETEDGPVTFTSDTGRDWLELTGSLTRQVSRKTTLYGSAGYHWDLHNEGHAWSGRLGVRFNW